MHNLALKPYYRKTDVDDSFYLQLVTSFIVNSPGFIHFTIWSFTQYSNPFINVTSATEGLPVIIPRTPPARAAFTAQFFCY
jgi:hypothetical protein